MNFISSKTSPSHTPHCGCFCMFKQIFNNELPLQGSLVLHFTTGYQGRLISLSMFFLWKFVKNSVFLPFLSETMNELLNRITIAEDVVTSNMIAQVWNEFNYRALDLEKTILRLFVKLINKILYSSNLYFIINRKIYIFIC